MQVGGQSHAPAALTPEPLDPSLGPPSPSQLLRIHYLRLICVCGAICVIHGTLAIPLTIVSAYMVHPVHGVRVLTGTLLGNLERITATSSFRSTANNENKVVSRRPKTPRRQSKLTSASLSDKRPR